MHLTDTNPPTSDEMRHNFYAICKLSDYLVPKELFTMNMSFQNKKTNKHTVQILDFFGNLIVQRDTNSENTYGF